ncbi:MAG: glycosyltransferase family 2 protein [Gammaproteobacteria bacterium]
MTLIDKTNILIIVPAFNEQDSIVSVIEQIKNTGFSFVVIDDGSTDETRKRAKTAGARTISLPFNGGVGAAMKCGFQYAVKNNYLAIVQIDADGQHPVSGIDNLIKAVNESRSDMVIGSRFKSEHTDQSISEVRLKAISVLCLVARLLTQKTFTDPTSGIRLIRYPLLKAFAEQFPREYLGDTFGALIFTERNNYVATEIAIPFANRIAGKPSTTKITALGFYCRVILNTLFHLKPKQSSCAKLSK